MNPAYHVDKCLIIQPETGEILDVPNVRDLSKDLVILPSRKPDEGPVFRLS